MTTTNVEVSKDLPKPGTLVLVKSSALFSGDSCMGVICTPKVWSLHSSSMMREYFEQKSKIKPQVQVVVFDGFDNWRVCFESSDQIKEMFSVCDDAVKFSQCVGVLECCTHRDGSLYHKRFYRNIILVRKFFTGEKNIEDHLTHRYTKVFQDFVLSLCMFDCTHCGKNKHNRQKTKESYSDGKFVQLCDAPQCVRFGSHKNGIDGGYVKNIKMI